MEEKSFLDEGFDFIEESYSACPLEYTEVKENIIVEANGEKSPYHILGTCRGVFQPINEPSRNQRIYESKHWEIQLAKPEVQERLKRRGMWGTLGHFDRKVTDADVREGLVSHIITKLEIRENEEHKPYLYGELEILDTPSGRILEAMYKGGANLYVSSRGAGKLIPVPGKDYAMVKPDSYFVECFDVVCRPGFLKAKPVYEGIKESTEVSESQVDEEVKEHLPNGQKEDLLTTVYGAMNTKRARKGKKMLPDDQIKKGTCESEEIEELKGQINKLAKIVEKVVDDVYEEPAAQETVEEQLGKILFDESVSESAFENTIAILKESNPELVDKIMENSRKKFNAEHGDKSGLEIEYYRFAGKHPYKIVPKGTDYFAASHDSPTYRTLKQAQKHILDTYNKPDKNEAFTEFASLMASTNISEEVFKDIIDIIAKAKKENK